MFAYVQLRAKTSSPRYIREAQRALRETGELPNWASRLIRETKAGRGVENLHRRRIRTIGSGEEGRAQLSLYGGGSSPGLSVTKLYNPGMGRFAAQEAEMLPRARDLLRDVPVRVPKLYRFDPEQPQRRAAIVQELLQGKSPALLGRGPMSGVENLAEVDRSKIVEAIKRLHRGRLVHGDLDLKNVLLEPGMHPGIVDWSRSETRLQPDKFEELLDRWVWGDQNVKPQIDRMRRRWRNSPRR